MGPRTPRADRGVAQRPDPGPRALRPRPRPAAAERPRLGRGRGEPRRPRTSRRRHGLGGGPLPTIPRDLGEPGVQEPRGGPRPSTTSASSSSNGAIRSPPARFTRRPTAIRRKLDPDGLDLASSLHGLGNVAWRRGDLASAEAFHRRALEIRQRLAPDSAAVETSLNSLGNVAGTRKDLESAERFHRQALSVGEKLPNERVEAILHNLGEDARLRGDFDGAETFLRRALALHDTLPAGSSRSVAIANTLVSLAAVARDRGDLAEAENLIRQALAIRETYEPGTLHLAEDREVLADVLLARRPARRSPGRLRADPRRGVGHQPGQRARGPVPPRAGIDREEGKPPGPGGGRLPTVDRRPGSAEAKARRPPRGPGALLGRLRRLLPRLRRGPRRPREGRGRVRGPGALPRPAPAGHARGTRSDAVHRRSAVPGGRAAPGGWRIRPDAERDSGPSRERGFPKARASGPPRRCSGPGGTRSSRASRGHHPATRRCATPVPWTSRARAPASIREP